MRISAQQNCEGLRAFEEFWQGLMSESAITVSVRAHILVHGLVQGVGFRAFASRAATDLRLVGGVRNLDDGRVELEVEGTKSGIEALEQKSKTGPPAARVTRVETKWGMASGQYSTFQIWY